MKLKFTKLRTFVILMNFPFITEAHSYDLICDYSKLFAVIFVILMMRRTIQQINSVQIHGASC
jgi:hypothetical protein